MDLQIAAISTAFGAKPRQNCSASAEWRCVDVELRTPHSLYIEWSTGAERTRKPALQRGFFAKRRHTQVLWQPCTAHPLPRRIG